jgi:hypothetical protein
MEAFQTSFDIVLSQALSADALAKAIAELAPEGLSIVVGSDLSELSEKHTSFWSVVRSTGDPAWPCLLEVFGCGEELGLGRFPDLRLAAHIGERFGMDALCGTYPFVGPLDPHDPFWSLALVEGRWFLASTVEMKLMDERATGAIKLIREVEVPAG